jgi:hypothetical protein
MPEYEANRLIDVEPDEVFRFVSDIGNLPLYVPTVDSASTLPGGRVRVEGRLGDVDYADDGFLKIDEDRRRIEWRADERNYRGWLEVGDEDGRSRVRVHLVFGSEKIDVADAAGADEPLRDERPVFGPGAGDPISLGLEATLDSLHDLLLGRGGKREVAGPSPGR